MCNLVNTLKIKNKDIITIVGAGGKTSLMFSASSFLRKDYKVLVTTTTKIYVPEETFYDEMIMLNDKKDNKNCFVEKYKNIMKNGVYVIGNYIINNSKIKGLSFEQLDKVISYFDIVIIEGDGSKEKPLKGWNDSEPVIYPKSTKTIGVVDISSIGMNINEENIHRLDRFIEIINNNLSKKVRVEHLKDMIVNPNGLFKSSKGEQVLFINKCENINSIINSKELIKNIKYDKTSYIDNFIYGSVLKNEFIEG